MKRARVSDTRLTVKSESFTFPPPAGNASRRHQGSLLALEPFAGPGGPAASGFPLTQGVGTAWFPGSEQHVLGGFAEEARPSSYQRALRRVKNNAVLVTGIV